MDSHADTCVVGDNALIIHDFDRPVDVEDYDGQGKKTNCRTVSAVIAYDDPKTGEAIMLILHQAIFIPGMKHNLLCPMQLRLNDVEVNETPKFLIEEPTEYNHALVLHRGDDAEYVIPMSLQGVTSYFPSRKPQAEEFEASELHYELTSELPEWNPLSDMFSQQEEATMDPTGRVHEKGDGYRGSRNLSGNGSRIPNNVSMSRTSARKLSEITSAAPLVQISTTYNDGALLDDLKSHVNVNVSGVTSSERRKAIDPVTLSKKWGIGLEVAKQTVKVTTQRGIRTVLHPSLSRRFRTNDRALRYRRLQHDMFTDTLISKTTSKRGNKCAQIFGTGFGWTRAFPMKNRSYAHEGLSLLAKRDGAPPTVFMDNAREQAMGKFRHKCREIDIHVKQLEPYTPWSNQCEGEIKELKRGVGRKMVKSKSPKVLWDDCLEFESLIRSNTAHNIYELNGEVPETIVSGQTSDISHFCELEWYEWVKFRDSAIPFPEDKEVLGRYCGPSIDIGPAMTIKILKANGEQVHRSTYRPLTQNEINNPEEIKERKEFDDHIKELFGPGFDYTDFEGDEDIETPVYQPYADDTDGEEPRVPDEDDVTPEYGDIYIGAQVLLPFEDKVLTGKVVSRKQEHDGSLKGHAHSNPILDTREYNVEFPDGSLSAYSANIIAESMYAQCDLEGNQNLLMDCIVDHRKNEQAVRTADMYVIHNGRKHIRKTTIGWELCVQWKDGTTSWERLADLKESYPVEVSEYAVAQGIDQEPAFIWWVHYTLKKRDRIIASVNRRYKKRNFQFGLEVPQTIEDAKRIDKENGNTLWMDAIAKEMKSVKVAFKVLDDDEKIPPGYQEMKCHLTFVIKIEGLVRKARCVAGGHMTETPHQLRYASVVSRESVRIALTIAALNDLEIKCSDVMCAFCQAPTKEKVWTVLGPEFGPDAGKRAIVVRAAYGLKSSSQAFREHLASCMKELGWESCKADRDVWLKPMVRPEDGFEYYAYMLIHTDDCLCVDYDATQRLVELDHYFKMKPGSIGDPDMYLGAKLRKTTLPNGVEAWSLSPSKYVQEAVRNFKLYLEKHMDGRKLLKKAPAPFPAGYRPEIDETPELNYSLANFYQSQIGILRWMVEIGRIDCITEASLLASHSAMPREGHLEALIHVFTYIEKKHNSRMIFDPTYPDIDLTQFKENEEWTKFYGNVKEAKPPNAPEPRGKSLIMRAFVDADHAGDQKTRRSRTGFLIYLNMAPIIWYSKKQSRLETSVFGSEFMSMKTAVDTIRGLRYKLRMMGVDLADEPCYIFGDNMSVIHNTQRPESTLKKKANAICYHAVRESVAMGESLTGYIKSELNPSDLASKIIYGGQKRNRLVNMILYDIEEHKEDLA